MAHSPGSMPPNQPPSSSPLARPGITARAIVIGALIIPLNAFWVVRLERVLFGPYPSTISLFPNAVFVLLLLIVGNAVVRRRIPRVALGQGELLTIYFMVAVSTGLAGLDGPAMLAQIVPHGAWLTAQAERWHRVAETIPAWLAIRDFDVVRGHFLGNSTFAYWPHLRAWLVPLGSWTLLVVLLLWTSMCLNVVLRKQWQDRERLSFPIVWLPLEMSDPGGGLWSNRLMWAGFAFAACLGLYNGIAFLYPSIPMVPVGIYDLTPLLTTKPWDAIDWLPTTLYPLAIGLGYLLPTDLLFSCWFFFLAFKGQLVVSNAFAWDATPDFPFIREQGFGAVMALAGFYVWTSRTVFAEAWARPSASDDGAMSTRAALIGAGVGLVACTAFLSVAGMTWWLALTVHVMYLAVVVVVCRVRAELGPPVHDFHFIGPDRMLPRIFGVEGWRREDLGMMATLWAFNRAHRGDVQPVGLEALTAAHRRGWEPRRMFTAIMVAVVVGTLGAFWAHETQAYALGTSARFNQGVGQAQEVFDKLSGWLEGTQDSRPNVPAVWSMAGGAATCLALMVVRMRTVGFPFHPIGFAVASGWSIHLVWLPLMIAWAVKILVMRYGGLALYRRLLPFFLGLILGDCVQGSLWGLASLALNMRMYNSFGA
ncbi:MAG TPA: DUF6785 family protein [Chthonomonadales bacterium]|nr:DUF6785 family protein [Chthonomonadales bacterium]